MTDFGWPATVNDYTMICNYDYPKKMAKQKIGSKEEGTIFSFEGDSYQIFCDGSAQKLLVGAIAASGAIISL